MDIILKIYEEDFPIFDEVDIISFELANMNSENMIFIDEVKIIDNKNWVVVVKNNANYKIKTYLELDKNLHINPLSIVKGSIFQYKGTIDINDHYTLINGLVLKL